MDISYHNYIHQDLNIDNVPYKDGQLDVVTKLILSSIIKSMKRTNVRSCDYSKASMITSF